MQITDFETGRLLRDVDIILTPDEAEELVAYLAHLLREPSVICAHVSQFRYARLESELTVSLSRRSAAS